MIERNPPKFKTLWFEWYDLGPYLAAKDPLIDEMRWIIKPSTHGGRYDLAYVRYQQESHICTGQNLRDIMWTACSVRLNQISEMLFIPSLASNNPTKEKARTLLDSMCEGFINDERASLEMFVFTPKPPHASEGL